MILTYSLDKAKWKCSFFWHLRKGSFVIQLSNGWRNVFSLPPILKGFDPQSRVIHLFLGMRVVMNVNMFVSDTVYFGNLPSPICFISIFHLSLSFFLYLSILHTDPLHLIMVVWMKHSVREAKWKGCESFPRRKPGSSRIIIQIWHFNNVLLGI